MQSVFFSVHSGIYYVLVFTWLDFLPLDAMRKRGLCCRPVSVCPSVCLSVCLSVMFVHSIQTAKAIVKLFNNNNNRISKAPYGRNFRGAGNEERTVVPSF